MPINATYDLPQSPLYKLRSRKRLAQLLRIAQADLRALESGDDLYREFDIPKKNGTGSRHVENPCRSLKVTQARISRLLGRVTPPDFLFCPVKRRCYVSNAAAHRTSRVVQCLDIKNFFPSTPQRRVFWFFEKVMKCERDVAALLANLACYKQHLPTGSPLSPILAYFAYYDLWAKIDDYCKARNLTFTVYVDDVTVSGERVTREDMWHIRRLIHGYGLRYHKAKTYIDRPAEITGVIVSEGKLLAPFRQNRKKHEAQNSLIHAEECQREAILGRIAGIQGQLRQISKMN